MGFNFQEIEKELEGELREIAGEEDFNKFKEEAEKETNKKIQENGEITSEEVDELLLFAFALSQPQPISFFLVPDMVSPITSNDLHSFKM